MKYFDINGIYGDSFSIGTGNNKTELKAVDGKLYLKNYSSSNIKDLEQSLILAQASVPEWTQNTQYYKDSLIYYNDIIFLCLTDHISSSVFDENKFIFIISFSGLVKINALNGNNFQIQKIHGENIYFYGTNTGIQNVYFTDCLYENISKKLNILNFSNCKINLYAFDQTTQIGSVNENQVREFILIDNSDSNGIWKDIDYFQLEEREINETRIEISNSFSIGDVIGHDGINWIKLNANSIYAPLGIVRDCSNSFFIIVFYGYINLTAYSGTSNFPFIKGKEYYLSETVNGNWTDSVNRIKLPVLTAFSNTEAMVNIKTKENLSFQENNLNNNDIIILNTFVSGIYLIQIKNNPKYNTILQWNQNSYLILKNNFDSMNLFTDSKDTAGTVNIYENSLTFELEIQNKTGSSLQIIITPLKGIW